jgi:hypothetical protein
MSGFSSKIDTKPNDNKHLQRIHEDFNRQEQLQNRVFSQIMWEWKAIPLLIYFSVAGILIGKS